MGMVTLPQTFQVTSEVIRASLLPKLEKVSGVKACRLCLHPHTVCECNCLSQWSPASTKQAPATVTVAYSHPSTLLSASILCPPPGLTPPGATAATSTYSEALTFTVPAPLQMRMRGVSCPPLPGVRYPIGDFCPGASSPRMNAPIRTEHPISLKGNPQTPYCQQVQAPRASATPFIGRAAMLEAMWQKTEELAKANLTPVGRK